jgi:hypothetical protein
MGIRRVKMNSIDNLENMDLLDLFFKVRQAVYDYFGFVEDYVVYPIEDYREYYWRIADNGEVVAFGAKNDVIYRTGNHYENTIYTQRFYDKWVYRGEKYTMIFVDTHTDGNKFFGIYDNAKEIKEDEL